MLISKTPPIGPIGGWGLTFWISATNSDQNVMKFFLANILVIWDGRCDFFGSLSVSGRKKGGVKKKSRENLPFFVFFLKNDQILTNTKTFKIRFFFHRNVQTSPQHPFKHISNNFGVKYAYLDIILEFL